MEFKVTRPGVKKLLKENGKVNLTIFERGKDPNHFMTSGIQVEIKDISELDGRVLEEFNKFSGKKQFSMAIWKEEGDEL